MYLVRHDAEATRRWMYVTPHLQQRQDKKSRQVMFAGERLDAPAVWRVRDAYIARASSLVRAMLGDRHRSSLPSRQPGGLFSRLVAVLERAPG